MRVSQLPHACKGKPETHEACGTGAAAATRFIAATPSRREGGIQADGARLRRGGVYYAVWPQRRRHATRRRGCGLRGSQRKRLAAESAIQRPHADHGAAGHHAVALQRALRLVLILRAEMLPLESF